MSCWVNQASSLKGIEKQMNKNNTAYKVLRSIYRFFKYNIFYRIILLPYGRKKHRLLLKTTDRKNDHTYTSFFRSPPQLEVLSNSVLDFLQKNGQQSRITINVFAASTGAEPYTIASHLKKTRPELDFHIFASDLHQSTVEKAKSGIYTLEEITQGLVVTNEQMAQTFDKLEGDQYRVKEDIRKHITFTQADLLDNDLSSQFNKADIVFAQNVLFHMPPAMARQAFANIISFLKPHSVLFIDGMEIEMRVELTKKAKLKPLNQSIREIYEYSRKHFPEKWWKFYWGNEPYFPLSRSKQYRYGTIFYQSTDKEKSM